MEKITPRYLRVLQLLGRRFALACSAACRTALSRLLPFAVAMVSMLPIPLALAADCIAAAPTSELVQGVYRIFPVAVDVALEPIASGSNSAGSYRAHVDGAVFYAKALWGPTCLNAKTFEASNRVSIAAGRLGIGPAVYGVDAATRVRITDFVGGRAMTAAAMHDPQHLWAVMALLKRWHGDMATGGTDLYDADSLGAGVPSAAQALRAMHDPAQESAHVHAALRLAAVAAARLAGRASAVTACHLDPQPGNFIYDGTRPWLVDFDAWAFGDPLVDLALFALESDYEIAGLQPIVTAYANGDNEVDITTLQLRLALLHARVYLQRIVGMPWHVAEERAKRLVGLAALVEDDLAYLGIAKQ